MPLKKAYDRIRSLEKKQAESAKQATELAKADTELNKAQEQLAAANKALTEDPDSIENQVNKALAERDVASIEARQEEAKAAVDATEKEVEEAQDEVETLSDLMDDKGLSYKEAEAKLEEANKKEKPSPTVVDLPYELFQTVLIKAPVSWEDMEESRIDELFADNTAVIVQIDARELEAIADWRLAYEDFGFGFILYRLEGNRNAVREMHNLPTENGQLYVVMEKGNPEYDFSGNFFTVNRMEEAKFLREIANRFPAPHASLGVEDVPPHFTALQITDLT